jgi:endo-beta-N-acetylglucosaminidase D
MADLLFNKLTEWIGDGTFDMDDDTFYIALFNDASTPAATYQSYDTGGAGVALTADFTEASGTGYVTGGKTIGASTWNESSGTTTFDAPDVQWTGSTISAYWAAIYDYTDSNNGLVCLIDFGGQISTSNGTFTVEFHGSGIFTLASA